MATANNYKDFFDLDPKVTYLNCGAYSPLLKTSVKAGTEGLLIKQNPQKIIANRDFFENSRDLRTSISKLINANDETEIAIMPSVSYGMAIVAKNLPGMVEHKKNVILAGEEFPNNYHTFNKLCNSENWDLIQIQKSENWSKELIGQITDDTAAVVCPHVHWIYGYVFDLAAISEKCIKHKALLIVDGTQSIGVMSLDVQKIKIDALIVASYKWLLGPHSLCFSYFSEKFYDADPLEESWFNRKNSNVFESLLNYETEYRPKNQRFNVGEYSHFILTPILQSSLSFILELGVDNIKDHILSLNKMIHESLGNEYYNFKNPDFEFSNIYTLGLENDTQAKKVYAGLLENDIYISLREKNIRVSPYIYNSETDIENFIKTFKKYI